MSTRLLVWLFAALLFPAVAWAKPAVPTEDLPGSHDSPLLKRFQGSLIVSYEQKGQGELSLPLAGLERVPGRTDSNGNPFFEPKQKKDLVGAYTRLVYLLPEGRSSLEVVGNYADEIKSQGGKLLFECKGDACGGDPKFGSAGAGAHMSLSAHLYPKDSITDKFGTPGYCLMMSWLSDRRYLAAELPQRGAHVSVYSFRVEAGACEGVLGNRTVALVQIVESKARENRMVAANAAEMAQAISSAGRALVYGIYFDSNQAEIKPESSAALDQIAKLLQEQAALKVLIVGHTDNVGGYTANVELSQRRAKAVVEVLTSRYKIQTGRLTPVGVSSASPLDTNKSEEGRAKNRRVEIVEQ